MCVCVCFPKQPWEEECQDFAPLYREYIFELLFKDWRTEDYALIANTSTSREAYWPWVICLCCQLRICKRGTFVLSKIVYLCIWVSSSLTLVQHVMLCFLLQLAYCFFFPWCSYFILLTLLYVLFCKSLQFNNISYSMLNVCWHTTRVFFSRWKRILRYTLYNVDIN